MKRVEFTVINRSNISPCERLVHKDCTENLSYKLSDMSPADIFNGVKFL